MTVNPYDSFFEGGAQIDWSNFQFQVFGAVLSVNSGTRDMWCDATDRWCHEHERRLWPNFYCGVNDYIGTYHVRREGELYASPNHTDAEAIIAYEPGGETPLAWATQEVLNFLRVAKRIDYLPTSYLSAGTRPAGSLTSRPVPG